LPRDYISSIVFVWWCETHQTQNLNFKISSGFGLQNDLDFCMRNLQVKLENEKSVPTLFLGTFSYQFFKHKLGCSQKLDQSCGKKVKSGENLGER